MNTANLSMRPAVDDDAAAVAEIYNEAIRTTTATFDTVPKSTEDRAAWLAAHDERHPVFVAECDGQVVAWAALTRWSDRPAYDQTAETSTYVAERYRGRGIGRTLKVRLIDEARRLGFHTLIAGAAEGSDASIRLNESLGFERVGTLREVGFKFGRRLDVHYMQLMLDTTPPPAAEAAGDATADAIDQRLISERFPRASRYHPDWVIGTAMGSNALQLTEWLSEAMAWRQGMRVLDLGCGRAATSIFLAREFGLEVWATDLWMNASENIQRIRDAGLSNRVFPLHADARALPFAAEFFDAIVVIDAFSYFGTDNLYLNYLAQFVKPGGAIGIAGAGLMHEVETVPAPLRAMWTEDFWCLHSAAWWGRHWARTGIVDVEFADTMPDGWQVWLDWQTTAHPDNQEEIAAIDADRGEHLGYIRLVGRRRADAALVDYCWPDTMRSFPIDYQPQPLLRGGTT